MGTSVRNALPRWRGFNLLEKFSHNDSSKSVRYGQPNPAFREDDFRWIADWGFDFVRLPMSYRCWSEPERWLELDEAVLAQVDEAVELGAKYGIHVCLNLHRAPGYCVNPPAEPMSLWREAEALAACVHHWSAFARRYRGIPSERLSFDLLNEPPRPCEAMTRKEHEQVIRALVGAIREIDGERLIIADGLAWGNEPIPELLDLGIGQSCRAYAPMEISHYQASWVKGERFGMPCWPLTAEDGTRWDRARLEAHFAPWAELMAQGIGVHCGEGGCFNQTPHGVFLAWFRDVLEVLTGLGIGFAIWNFRGSFGVLDSGRSDVETVDWYGHQLDKGLLELLQAF